MSEWIKVDSYKDIPAGVWLCYMPGIYPSIRDINVFCSGSDFYYSICSTNETRHLNVTHYRKMPDPPDYDCKKHFR